MRLYIILLVMIPLDVIVMGIGIYAMKRKAPMWFYAGSSISEEEISDVAAFNRANGYMWLGYSGILWISTIVMMYYPLLGGILLAFGCVMGGLLLPIIHGKLCEIYRKEF